MWQFYVNRKYRTSTRQIKSSHGHQERYDLIYDLTGDEKRQRIYRIIDNLGASPKTTLLNGRRASSE
jgi:hypothetical protein